MRNHSARARLTPLEWGAIGRAFIESNLLRLSMLTEASEKRLLSTEAPAIRRRGEVFRYAPFFYFLLALFPLISFELHFKGAAILGWDSEPPMRPESILSSAFSMWHSSAFFGQSNPSGIPYFIPLGALYTILYAAGANVQIAQKIVLTLEFIAPAFTAYWFARAIFQGRDHLKPFLCGLFYALSPVLFSRFYIPIDTVQWMYALTPAVGAASLAVLRSRRFAFGRALATFCIIEILAISGAANPAFWLAAHFIVVFVIVWQMCSLRDRTAVLGRVAALAVVICGINAIWAAPYFVFTLKDAASIASQPLNASYTAGAQHDAAASVNLADAIRLLSSVLTTAGDGYGKYWTYANVIGFPLIGLLYFSLPLLAIYCLLRRRNRGGILMCGFLLVFAAMTMKASAPPFGFVMQLLDRMPLVGVAFRNPFDKFAPLAAIALAILAVQGLILLLQRFALSRTMTAWAGVALALALSFPLWTGQMFMTRSAGPSLAVKPPQAALSFFKSLDSFTGRLLFLPVSDNDLLMSTTWGFFGPNIYGALTQAPMITMRASTLNNPGANDIVSWIYGAVRSGNTRQFLGLASLAGIRGIVIATDASATYYGGMTPEQSIAFVKTIPGIREARHVGGYSLWVLPDNIEAGSPKNNGVMPLVTYDSSIIVASALLPYCRIPGAALAASSAAASCAITAAKGSKSARAYRVLTAPLTLKVSRAANSVSIDISTSDGDWIARKSLGSADLMAVNTTPFYSKSLVMAAVPGAATSVWTYRPTAPAKALPLTEAYIAPMAADQCCGLLEQISASSLGVVASAPTAVRLLLSTTPKKSYVVTLTTSRSPGTYREAVTNKLNGAVLAESRVSANPVRLVFTAASAKSEVYIYLIPAAQPVATHFLITGAMIQPASKTLLTSFLLPNVTPTNLRAVDYGVGNVSRSQAANRTNTIFVQNGQYDNLFSATAHVGGRELSLRHVAANGFLNGWIVPKGAKDIRVTYGGTKYVFFGALVSALTLITIGILCFFRVGYGKIDRPRV